MSQQIRDAMFLLMKEGKTLKEIKEFYTTAAEAISREDARYAEGLIDGMFMLRDFNNDTQ